jgi:hypothetical protein
LFLGVTFADLHEQTGTFCFSGALISNSETEDGLNKS